MVDWKTKHPGNYEPGCTMEWSRFALFPTKATDGRTYWLVRLNHTYARYTDGPWRDSIAFHPSKLPRGRWKLVSIKPFAQPND